MKASKTPAMLGLGLGLLLLASASLFLLLALIFSGSGHETEASDFDSERAPDSPTRNLVVEKEWPREIELTESQEVRLKLIPGDADEEVSDPQARGTDSSIVDLEDGYVLKSATARLDGANFEVREVTERTQSAEGRNSLEWVWNLAPRQEGRQVLTAYIDLDAAEADGGDSRPPPWSGRLEIEVSDSTSFLSNLPIISIVTGFFGSAMSIPFGFAVWKEWRSIRKSRDQGEQGSRTKRSTGRTPKVRGG